VLYSAKRLIPSDQVMDMAQVQQIYARLLTHIDITTSLLLLRQREDDSIQLF
jgi:hypothetical protein